MFKHFLIYRIVVVVLILMCTTSLSIAQSNSQPSSQPKPTYIYDGPDIDGPYYSLGYIPDYKYKIFQNLTKNSLFGSFYVLDKVMQNLLGYVLGALDFLVASIPQLFILIAVLLYTISLGIGAIELTYKRDKFGTLVKVMTLLMTITIATIVYNIRQPLFYSAYALTTKIPDIISYSIQQQVGNAFDKNLNPINNSIFAAKNIVLTDSRSQGSNYDSAPSVYDGYRYPTSTDYRFGVADFNIDVRTARLKDVFDFLPGVSGSKYRPIGFFAGFLVRVTLLFAYGIIVAVKNIAGLMIMLRLLIAFMCTPFYGYRTVANKVLRLNIASALHWAGYLILLGLASAIFLSGLEASLSPLIYVGNFGATNFNWGYFLGAALLGFIIIGYSYKISNFLSALVLGSDNNRKLTTIGSPNSKNKESGQSAGNSNNAGKAMGAALAGAAGAQMGASLAGAAGAQMGSQPAGGQGMSGGGLGGMSRGLGAMMPNFANSTISGNGEDSIMSSRAYKQSFTEINSEGEVIGQGEHYVVGEGNTSSSSPYGETNSMFNRNPINNGADGDGSFVDIDPAGAPAGASAMNSNISPNISPNINYPETTADAPQPSRLEKVKKAVGQVKTGVAQAVHIGKSVVDAPLKAVSAVTGGPKDEEGNIYHDSFFRPIESDYRRYEKGSGSLPKFNFPKFKKKNKGNEPVNTSIVLKNDDFRNNVFPNSRKRNNDLLMLSENSQAYLEYKKTHYLPMPDNPTYTTADASGTFKNTEDVPAEDEGWYSDEEKA